MSELVTGEAVVLDIRLARPATRAIAVGIDLAVETAALLALTIPLGYVMSDAGAGDALIGGLTIFIMVAIFVGYPTAIEAATRGKSLGKYAMGLRVVRDDGGPIRFRHALVRALAGVFADFFTTVGCGALLTSMLNARGKRIGDLLAGTIVIRERAPRATEQLPDVPPALQAWAGHAEMSRVPDDLAMSARSFLARFHELSPSARNALGARLARAVAQYVSPPPPPGVPDWAYLTAVLTERRRRALAAQNPSASQDVRSDPPAASPSPPSRSPWASPDPPPPAAVPGATPEAQPSSDTRSSPGSRPGPADPRPDLPGPENGFAPPR